MLRLVVGEDGFNDETQEFIVIDPVVVDFEHSLVSLSKWESEYQKPFLSSVERTNAEIFGYVKAMVVTPGVGQETLVNLSDDQIKELQQYIDSPQSATTFGVMPQANKGRGETITAELIYYWMVAFKIPFECETWHLNRLFALIRICNIKNSKPEKRSQHDMAVERQRLNAERRARLGTKG